MELQVHRTQLIGFLFLFIKASGQQTDCACYGNDITIDSIMPNCTSSDGLISIESIYRAAKPISVGCANPVSAGTRDEATCCTYNSGADCRINLTMSDIPTVYSDCTGVATCSKQVTWQGTTSDCDATFMSQTNYMCIDYYCLPKSDSLEFCVTSGTEVVTTPSYFFNDGYSSGISHVNCCACVLTASAASATIDLDILDLELYDSSATCLQTVFVTDGSVVTSYNCTENNDYVIKKLLTSTGNSLTVTLKSDATVVGNGKAWFRASASSGGLSTSCSSVAQCPDETTTPNNGQESGNDGSNSSDTGLFGLSWLIFAVIVAASLLLVLCTCVLCCFVCNNMGKSKSFDVAKAESSRQSDSKNLNATRIGISYPGKVRKSGDILPKSDIRSNDIHPIAHLRSLKSTNAFSSKRSTGIIAQRPFENRLNRNSHFRRTSLPRVESPWTKRKDDYRTERKGDDRSERNETTGQRGKETTGQRGKETIGQTTTEQREKETTGQKGMRRQDREERRRQDREERRR